MAQDDKVIGYISPAELLNLMRETGMISVQETGTSEGKPVIHAVLKLVHAQTGAELPGGLPFSVVMFKGATEPGYSNIAIGTVVPAAELEIVLPADFFNLCNRRFRFIRAFPLDASSFVLQMDLFVRGATQEYLKFSFGLWAALFSQVLFELMGHGTQSLSRAADVYAAAPADFTSRNAEAITSDFQPLAEEWPVEEAAAVVEPVPEPVREPVPEPVAAATESQPPAEAATAPETEAVLAAEAVTDKAENATAGEIVAEKTTEGDDKAEAVEPAVEKAEKAETVPV